MLDLIAARDCSSAASRSSTISRAMMTGAGRVLMEWLLELSAQGVSGPKIQRRKVERDVHWHARRAASMRIGVLSGHLVYHAPIRN